MTCFVCACAHQGAAACGCALQIVKLGKKQLDVLFPPNSQIAPRLSGRALNPKVVSSKPVSSKASVPSRPADTVVGCLLLKCHRVYERRRMRRSTFLKGNPEVGVSPPASLACSSVTSCQCAPTLQASFTPERFVTSAQRESH